MLGGVSRITDQSPGRDIKFQETDKKLMEMIDETDRKMLSYIARLYEATHNEKLDFEKIKNAVDALQQFNSRNEYTYLNNLLHPEKCKGVKIPSQIPIPSCSFQLHNCVTLRTNASGNLAIMFNPYFLASNIHKETLNTYNLDNNRIRTHIDVFSSLFVNNDPSLDGYSSNENWLPINIGQEIPPVYDQYRLVSASLVIKYIGRLEDVSGIIGGAIVFDETSDIGGYYTVYYQSSSGVEVPISYPRVPNFLAKYGNFDLAMDSFYRQENLCLEGIRQLYFPIDNSYEEYTKLMNEDLLNITTNINEISGKPPTAFRMSYKANENYLKNGFNQMVYVLGAPANQTCFKLDIYCNFECLPSTQFLNYLPLSMSTNFITPEMKKEANIIVQQKPIMKSTEGDDNSNPAPTPSIWDKMKTKFMDSLPGIGKLVASGLVQAIPQLQLGTGLANAMSIAGNAIVNSIGGGS